MDFDQLTDVLFENLKEVFFPEEWLDLDRKFSKSELFSLLLIEKRKEITMSELAEYIHAPMSTATGIIDRLVRAGYIVRERSDEDRRIVVLKLTDDGVREIGSLKKFISSYINRAADKLTPEEIQTLIQIAGKILAVFRDEAAGRPAERADDTVRKIEIE